MLKFTSTEEAIKYFQREGYKVTDPPAGVGERCLAKYGAWPVYMLEPESRADIFILEGKPIAALHSEDGSIDIDL